jgi:NDP-sugar pyrophosphorylase family protein
MQAVILCAGKGTRMGELTRETPKPLLRINGKSLLAHKLDVLPSIITEIVIVVGYLGEKIKAEIGDKYKGRPVKYAEDKTLTGTAPALWQAKPLLGERFIVMMGDDVYSSQAMVDCLAHEFSVVGRMAAPQEAGSRIHMNEKKELRDFVTSETYRNISEDPGLICTGLYSLTQEFFTYEPVKLGEKNEWGLPHTLLLTTKDRPVQVVETDFWLSISSPEDLKKAEVILNSYI